MFKLEVENLTKARGYDDIFSGISFILKQGQLLWLRGANGSGKTTLLRILAGLSSATSGVIINPVNDLHYISHKPEFMEQLTVKETLENYYPLLEVKADNQQYELLSELGLARQLFKRAGSLSAGQKQRLKLLKLILQKRKLWLLDEPYNNLDQAGRDWLNQVMQNHVADDGMIILTCHSDVLAIEPSQVINLHA